MAAEDCSKVAIEGLKKESLCKGPGRESAFSCITVELK
jgi:hypothetical protein